MVGLRTSQIGSNCIFGDCHRASSSTYTPALSEEILYSVVGEIALTIKERLLRDRPLTANVINQVYDDCEVEREHSPLNGSWMPVELVNLNRY